MSLDETRASSFISCGKTGEQEPASGTQTLTCHELPCCAGSPGDTMGVGLPKPPTLPWVAGDGGSTHQAHETCVRVCSKLLWASRRLRVSLGGRGQVVSPGGEGTWRYCAQDCKSEKPLRSRHRCKHTMVDFQTRACVQVHLTQRSMDLDPEVGFSLVLRAGLGDLEKGWSNSSSSFYILIWGLQGH